MDQLPPVQKSQGLQDGRQQFLDFLAAQRAVTQNLGECLVGILHHHEKIILPLAMPSADLEQLNEVGVGQVDGRLPPHQQGLGLRRVRANELDGGLGQVLGLVFGQEHRPLVRPAQATTQDETLLDDLVLPGREGVREGRLSGFRAHRSGIRCRRELDSFLAGVPARIVNRRRAVRLYGRPGRWPSRPARPRAHPWRPGNGWLRIGWLRLPR